MEIKNIVGHRIGKPACVVSDGKILKVGNNFGDAVTGIIASKGEIRVRKGKNGTESAYLWQSSLSCSESEKALRSSVSSEGLTVTYFRSQAVR